MTAPALPYRVPRVPEWVYERLAARTPATPEAAADDDDLDLERLIERSLPAQHRRLRRAGVDNAVCVELVSHQDAGLDHLWVGGVRNLCLAEPVRLSLPAPERKEGQR